MKTFRPLLTFFGVLFTCIGYANNLDGIRFTHIGLEEGLSHCTIFGINQDKEGNLWFATYDGVNKYDGYNFTVYRHQYANPQSIACDISRCVTVDDSGRVWIGTREGFSLYNRDQDTFSNYFYKENGYKATVTCIAPMNKDYLMLGTTSGVLLFDIGKERILNDTLPHPLHLLRPTAMVSQSDKIYIGVEKGLYVYSLANGTLEKLVDMQIGRAHV